MRESKQPDVPTLIATDPMYRAVVKVVGYGKPLNVAVIEALKSAIEVHGEKPLAEASKALLDIETHAGTLYCCIKPAYHVHCRMLLGPMPSEWDTWWQNADGTDRPGKPKVWPPTLPGPPALTKEENELRALPLAALAERLHAARRRMAASKPGGKPWCAASEEVAALETEYDRRAIVAPVTPEENRLATLNKRHLARQLRDARRTLAHNGRRSVAGKEAKKEIEQLEAEYRRRGLDVPAAGMETTPVARTQKGGA